MSVIFIVLLFLHIIAGKTFYINYINLDQQKSQLFDNVLEFTSLLLIYFNIVL